MYALVYTDTQTLIYREDKMSFSLASHLNDSVKIKKTNKPKVFFALDPECPLCKSYSKTINDIYITHHDKIDFYGFFPTKVLSKKKIDHFIETYELNMTCIMDTNQILTYFLDAKITPECFLLDGNLKPIYQGLIDDWVKELGRKGQHAHNKYLIDAINAYFKNEPIKIKKTKAIGCIIERLP